MKETFIEQKLSESLGNEGIFLGERVYRSDILAEAYADDHMHHVPPASLTLKFARHKGTSLTLEGDDLASFESLTSAQQKRLYLLLDPEPMFFCRYARARGFSLIYSAYTVNAFDGMQSHVDEMVTSQIAGECISIAYKQKPAAKFVLREDTCTPLLFLPGRYLHLPSGPTVRTERILPNRITKRLRRVAADDITRENVVSRAAYLIR